MKIKNYYFRLIVATLVLMLMLPLKLSALNYNITFTGSGASTSVASVVVQNLTKGTTVTVPAGNILNLSDVGTSLNYLNEKGNEILLYSNLNENKTKVSFLAKHAGLTHIDVFNIDGKQLLSSIKNIQEGEFSFQLSLPKGNFVLQITGINYSYSAKIISQLSANSQPKITVEDAMNEITNRQKVKSDTGITSMLYTSGDQLLYKGISGIYSTIVPDVPTGSKTVNFGFITCQDANGNNYTIVTIGTQTWMAENLRTTKYNDNTDIPNVTDNTAWSNLTSGAYCDHSNNANNGVIYGHLYNWFTLNRDQLAPIGWHVPSDAELTTLITFLGGDNVAGGKLKETGTVHWVSPNTGATNEVGFTALPAGGRSFDGIFPVDDIGFRGQLWTSTQFDINPAYYRGIPNNNTFAIKAYYNKKAGFSVRCLLN